MLINMPRRLILINNYFTKINKELVLIIQLCLVWRLYLIVQIVLVVVFNALNAQMENFYQQFLIYV